MRRGRSWYSNVAPPSPAGGRRKGHRDHPFDLCFADLAGAGPLLVAVSGGPDSMALLHAAAGWASRCDAPPPLHIATVDHGLRPESRSEAEWVAAAVSGLRLPHATLTWDGPKPTSRLQEKARTARYALLAGHARTIGATHILTAHHADDQAETVLLRLLHGSGIGGLAGMRRLSRLEADLWLARPLLDVAKADLVAFCHDRSVAFVEDPSNLDMRFERVRLRAGAAGRAALGLDTAALVRLGRRMARAEDALEAETDRVERALAPMRGARSYDADLADLPPASPEIVLRLLRRAVAHVAGERPIRLERLEALSKALRAALEADAPHRATLAGTRVMLEASGSLRIVAEPRRRRGTGPPGAMPERRD